jgi:hypothetical protein
MEYRVRISGVMPDIKYLDIEENQLKTKRQFILDRRNGWKHRIIWSIFAPIIVTIITLYLSSILR